VSMSAKYPAGGDVNSRSFRLATDTKGHPVRAVGLC